MEEYNYETCNIMIVETDRPDNESDSSSSSSSSDEAIETEKPPEKFWIIMCNRQSAEFQKFLSEISTIFYKLMIKVSNEELPKLPASVVVPTQLWGNNEWVT